MAAANERRRLAWVILHSTRGVRSGTSLPPLPKKRSNTWISCGRPSLAPRPSAALLAGTLTIGHRLSLSGDRTVGSKRRDDEAAEANKRRPLHT